jgi:hypothetical protein
MIRHIVLVKFRKNVDRATRDGIFRDLDGLRAHLDGVLGFHAGQNVSVETDLVRGYQDGFWFDFRDEAARDAYLADTRHREVGARIVAHAAGGIDGVTVFDIEIAD